MNTKPAALLIAVGLVLTIAGARYNSENTSEPRSLKLARSANPVALLETEPECIFDPPGTTNAINAPCYADLRAVAYNNAGNSATSDPVRIHFVPTPTPTPTPTATPTPTPTPTPVCTKRNPKGKCLRWTI